MEKKCQPDWSIFIGGIVLKAVSFDSFQRLQDTLKQEGSHVDYFIVTGYTWGSHHNHLKCSHWLQSSQTRWLRNSKSDYLSISVQSVW